MRWKAFFHDNPDDNEKTENFGFKTFACPPQNNDLKNFEGELLDMIKSITFQPIRNEFQNRLKEDMNTIKGIHTGRQNQKLLRNVKRVARQTLLPKRYPNLSKNG